MQLSDVAVLSPVWPVFFLVVAGVLGACLGSFVNCLALQYTDKRISLSSTLIPFSSILRLSLDENRSFWTHGYGSNASLLT